MSWRAARWELQSRDPAGKGRERKGKGKCFLALADGISRCSDRWSQEDMLTLLECMKNNLPSNDGSKFKTTESHLDWEKVAFKDFSGEMCKMKWMEISNEVIDSLWDFVGALGQGPSVLLTLLGLLELSQLGAHWCQHHPAAVSTVTP